MIMSKTTLQLPIYDQPAYRAAEAAHLLALPPGTVKAWSFGQDYLHRDGTPKRFRALIAPADAKARLLSFNNLCELHMLAAIRRHYRVSMPSVRDSVAFVRKQLKMERPLLSNEFQTNGVHLFIEHSGVMLNASREGQSSLSQAFERDLSRVERDARGAPVRLFPVTRGGPTVTGQPLSVVVDPNLAFGRPVLANAGVTTAVIQDRFLAGDSPSEMAEDYRVDEPEIWEAIRFEHRLAA
jgi:uncharacterized protein (DUF433 family)